MKFTDQLVLSKTLIARNRIIMPPMDTQMSEDGFANSFHVQHYGARAYGGFGTIIVESTAVMTNGVIKPHDLGIWKNEHIDNLKAVSAIIKQGGAIAGIQLNHAGAKADIQNITKFATTNKLYDYLDQTQLAIVTPSQLQSIEDAFVSAALRAKQAGFDFIELHAAHGYFLSNLIGKLTNDVIPTTDILKRSETLITILKRINQEVGIPAGIRISFTDHCEHGMQVEDYKPLVKAINDLVIYFHVSSGETVISGGVSELIKQNGILFRIPIAEQVKQWTTKPVFVVGNFRLREHIDLAMQKGIDGVAIGREAIYNPNLVWTSLLTSQEVEEFKYTWNNSPWFNLHKYKLTLDKFKK